MKYSELKKELRKNGCYKIRDGGNHEIWYSPVTGEEFPVGRHNSQEIPCGTLRNIQKASGLK